MEIATSNEDLPYLAWENCSILGSIESLFVFNGSNLLFRSMNIYLRIGNLDYVCVWMEKMMYILKRLFKMVSKNLKIWNKILII